MKLRDVLIFLSGAVIGGIVASKLTAKKYDKIIDDEIASVKKVFKEREEELEAKYASENAFPYVVSEEDLEDPPIISQERLDEIREEIGQIVKDKGYTSLEIEDPEFDGPLKPYLNNDTEKPYPIPPFEIGELPGYRVAQLISYANGVVTEEDEDVIYDIDDIIGEENFVHVGDYEPNMLYIRNDKYRTDYVIYECDQDYTDGIIDPRVRD